MAKGLAQRHRERRARQKAAGLCLQCNDPPKQGKAKCAKHLADSAGYQRKTARNRKDAGFCIRPGCFNQPVGDYSECQDCRDETSRRSARIKSQKDAERMAAGLCVKCGERPPRPQFAMCYVCQAVARAEWQRRQEIKRYESENGRERAD